MIESLTEIFQDVFEDDEMDVTRELSAQDVPAWDSLMHVNLILAIERKFEIRFSSSEVSSLKNAGDLIDLIETKS